MEKTKRCPKCKQTKLLDQFYNNKSKKDGKGSLCKNCCGEYCKENPHRIWVQDTFRNHRRRGYKINITINELIRLAKATTRCIYCNKRIIFQCRGREGKAEKNSPSLDRIDNRNKLSMGSVRIICHECNATKGSRTHEEFVGYCKNIIKKFSSK